MVVRCKEGTGLSGQFTHEPGTRHAPVEFNGAAGDAQGACGLIGIHAAEEAEFNETGLTFVKFVQSVQRVVQIGKVHILLGVKFLTVGESDSLPAAAAFGCVLTAGVVREDLAHRFRCNGAEMFFVGPAVTLPGKAHESFVDECGGLQGLPGLGFVKQAVGNTAEFLVGGLEEFCCALWRLI